MAEKPAQQLNVAASGTLRGYSGINPLDTTVEVRCDTLYTWRITRIAVRVRPVPPAVLVVLEPEFRVYVDSVADVNLLASTYTGAGDSSDEDQVLMPGQKLIGVWTGGDLGAAATMSVFGTKTPR